MKCNYAKNVIKINEFIIFLPNMKYHSELTKSVFFYNFFRDETDDVVY